MTDGDVINSGGTKTSTSLLRRASSGEGQAWQRLVSLYAPVVYRWCRQWGLQPADAENVGQEVFARVFRKLATFRRQKEGDTFRGWIYRIARNCVADQARRRRSEAAAMGGTPAQEWWAQIADEPDEPGDSGGTQERDLLYRRALALIQGEFSERDWRAFQQVVIEQQSPADVAARLQISVNVVYLAKSRVLSRLREEFEDLMQF